MAGGQNAIWERQPSESAAAFARFLIYRDLGATERSLAKVADHAAISNQLVARWSKRWLWPRRAIAYDNWLLELSDGLGKHAVLDHRRRAARLGSALFDKAHEGAMKLNPAKCSASEIALLSKAGAFMGDVAFGSREQRAAEPGPVVQVGVNFGNNQPTWINPNDNGTKQNEVLVHAEEKVLEQRQAALSRTGRTRNRKMLPPPQQDGKLRTDMKGLKEKKIAAPVRRDE